MTVAPRLGQAADLTPVKIAGTYSESASNVLYALEGGFFKQNGIDVALQAFSGSGAYANGILSGSFDVGSISTGSIVLAHDRNVPFVVIANGGVYSHTAPNTYLCVLKGSPIRTATDFKGKTIAVSTLGDITQVAVMGWLDRNGCDYHAVNFIEMTPSLMVPALQQKRIDGAFLGEPSLTTSFGVVTQLASPYDTVAPHFAIVDWVTSKSWAAANPDIVKRLQTAFARADSWAMANRVQAGAILAKYAKLTPELVEHMHHVDWVPGASATLMQPVVDAMARYGFIAKRFSADELL